ncbi:MAG: ABC transporter permease [Acutalibacteraceae bacterium]|nr:ABC transporter permease [Acutalibacteraceae bacterium]
MIENIRLSFKGIITHKMRSALTMLGIIIGIASIIVIVSIIEGTSDMLKKEMVNSGESTAMIELYAKEDSWSAYDSTYNGTIPGINKIDPKCVEEVSNVKGIKRAASVYKKEYSISFSYNDKYDQGSVYGVGEDYFALTDFVLSSGRLFIERDFTNRNNVAVISSSVASSFFSNENAVGKTITIGNEMFVVVGVVSKIKDYSNINTLSDYYQKVGYSMSAVYIPKTSWDLVAGYDDIEALAIQLVSPDDILSASTMASNILNQTINNENYEYKAGYLMEASKELEKITNTISMLLIGIASISLLVGGIGVMNIMLVSVTERTREIGLKKALGAKRRMILAQFLTEAVVLTSLGGFIGVILGIGISKVVAMAMMMTASVNLTAILISVGFSMFVGIVFGIVPSIKAAKLDPIEALRYE